MGIEHVDFSRTLLSDISIRALASNCPRLKFLSLIQCQNVTSKGVQLLADKCMHLEKVNVTGSEISGTVLRTILLNNAKSLRAITLDGAAGHLKNETIELLSNCQLLQEVDVALTADVTKDMIANVSLRCISKPNFKYLRFHGECSADVAMIIGEMRELHSKKSKTDGVHIITHLLVASWHSIQVDHRRDAVPTTDIGVKFQPLRPRERRQSVVPPIADIDCGRSIRMSRQKYYSLEEGVTTKLLVAG